MPYLDQLEYKDTLYDLQDTALKEEFDDITIIIPSTNLLNPSEIVQGKFIRLNGTEGNGDVYAHTGYIPVSAGDNIILADGDTANEFRFVTAYDSDKNVLASSGQEYGYSYVVPEGVAFVIISVTPHSKITSPTAKINNSSNPLPYEPYGDTVMPKGYDVLIPPSTAGTDTFKVTVASDGSKSYSWVSD